VVGIACHPRLRQAMTTPVGARAFAGERYGQPGLAYTPLEKLLPEGTAAGRCR